MSPTQTSALNPIFAATWDPTNVATFPVAAHADLGKLPSFGKRSLSLYLLAAVLVAVPSSRSRRAFRPS